MTTRRHLRLLPGGRRGRPGPIAPDRDVLLEVAGLRVVVEARALLVVLSNAPGLLEAIVLDPQARAALLPLLDAVEEYEERAEAVRLDG